jgi:hypothetical protein
MKMAEDGGRQRRIGSARRFADVRSSGGPWAGASSPNANVDLNDPTTVALLAVDAFEEVTFGGLVVSRLTFPGGDAVVTELPDVDIQRRWLAIRAG